MAKITSVTVGLTTSVKIAPYEYVKPEFSMTAQLEKWDKASEIIAELKELVNTELAKTAEILKAQKC